MSIGSDSSGTTTKHNHETSVQLEPVKLLEPEVRELEIVDKDEDLELPKLEPVQDHIRLDEDNLEQDLKYWTTLSDVKRSSQHPSLTIVSAENGTMGEEAQKQMNHQVSSRLTKKKKPRSHRNPNARPPLLLHYYFSPRKIPRRLIPLDSSAAPPKHPPLSHFRGPSPMGLSMRKVDIRPRPSGKFAVSSATPCPPSVDVDPYSSKPPTASGWRELATDTGQQYTEKENVNDVSKYWQLHFNNAKKVYDTMSELSQIDQRKSENIRQNDDALEKVGRDKDIRNPAKVDGEEQEMALGEGKNSKQPNRKYRHIDTL